MPCCGNCGNSILENQNYCPDCGQKTAQASALVHVGTLCSYCQKTIEKSQNVLSCPQCKTPHHQECWQENGGCSVYGCADYGFAGSPGSGAAIADGGTARGEGSNPAPADWNPYPMLVSLILLLAIASAGIMTASTATDTAVEVADGSLSIDVNRSTISPLKTIAEVLGERMEQARDDHAEEAAEEAAMEETFPISGTIHQAAERGDTEAVEQHLRSGVNVNAKDYIGWTPMHYAALEGHAETAWLLLDNGADVNARDDYGTTPLHEAAWTGHTEVARLLLENGADVNAETDRGWTPLHLAVVFYHSDIVELLQEYGGVY